jgi:hypothetical protein
LPVTGFVALGLGAVVLLLCVFLSPARTGDPAMEWEGRFAAGMAAALVAGPVWAAQLVLTFVACVPGSAPWWLWLWCWIAPVVGLAVGSPAPKSSR